MGAMRERRTGTRLTMALGLVMLLAISTLVTNAAAVQGRARSTVVFSGYTWDVKSTGWLMGPGPNLWSDDLSNVRVDESGALRLALTRRGGEWYCAEVSLQRSLGYGRYVFTVSSRVDLLEPGVMGALFVYEDDAHEIDIEFTGAGEAQYVVQPHYERGNLRGFDLDLEGDFTTHVIDWSPNRIVFSSYHGHYLNDPEEGRLIARWTYTGDNIPRAGEERLHINLWLRDGAAPSGPEEMVVSGFQFIPHENGPQRTSIPEDQPLDEPVPNTPETGGGRGGGSRRSGNSRGRRRRTS